MVLVLGFHNHISGSFLDRATRLANQSQYVSFCLCTSRAVTMAGVSEETVHRFHTLRLS